MTVAISSDFLQAFSNVQKSQQKQVREFIARFQDRPDSAGMNYEPVKGAKGGDLYSLRVSRAYRAIVFHPPGSSVYVLSWVDHHDEAYRWAQRKQLVLNPNTGSLQILPAQVAEEAPASARAKERTGKGLFAAAKDKHLLRLGVPEELLTVVRSIGTEEELDKTAPDLPQEASEVLYMLASGYTLDEVFQEMDKPEETETVDDQDFVAALKNEDSQRRFRVVDEAKELEEILSAPLEQWRVFLHPKQRRLAAMKANGPVRVLGGAGTGKTVVAMHRARHLVEKAFPSDRILFTTFTRNLATDIQENLRKICSVESLARIDVVNLDAWVANFLRGRGIRSVVVYDEEENEAWANALNQTPPELEMPTSFYRSEWELVVQAQNISDMEQYVRAARIGRGTRLSRAARRQIWPVFQEYRAQLNEQGKKEYVDLLRDARELIEAQGITLPYRAVVVDEAQDLSAEAYRLIRAIVPEAPNDLFMVGDAHQRIYRHRASLSQCGINSRGRGRKLKLNYRTTEEIRRFAVQLLEGRPIDDLDDGSDNHKGYLSLTHGSPPVVRAFDSLSDEVRFVREYIDRIIEEGTVIESVCLAARTKHVLDYYISQLTESGVRTYEIRRNTAERRGKPGLRAATMHRVKGLEFEHIIVVSANSGVIPLDHAVREAEDELARGRAETSERSLLHVAVTRGKRSALVTGFGELSPFLER